MTLPEVVYRCTWDTGWSQYHDASDPMPTKWDDKPPDFVEAFVSKIDAESRLAAADALLRDIKDWDVCRSLQPVREETFFAIPHELRVRIAAHLKGDGDEAAN